MVDGEFKIGRFERLVYDNDEWIEFIDKPLQELGEEKIISFKRLLACEYIESLLMENGMNFRSYIDPQNYSVFDFGAHDVSPKIVDSKYVNMDRIEAPPELDIEKLSNLDEILNWFINFKR